MIISDTLFFKMINRIKIKKELDKKSIINVHLNWIFAFIAGFVVLIIFFKIVGIQKNYYELNLAKNIANDINTIISNSRNDYENIGYFTTKEELSFDNSGMFVKVGKKSLQIPLESKLIFAPIKLKPKSHKVIIWALPFKYPFLIDSFVYLIPSEQRFIFLNNQNSDLVKKLYDKFPETVLKKITTNPSEIKKDDIVISKSNPTGKYKKWIQIKQDGIYLYKNSEKYEKKDFYDINMLIGLIVSDNFIYDSNLDTLNLRIKAISIIKKNKLQLLEKDVDNKDCINVYKQLNFILNYVLSATNNLNNLKTRKNEIENYNMALILNNCPLMY